MLLCGTHSGVSDSILHQKEGISVPSHVPFDRSLIAEEKKEREREKSTIKERKEKKKWRPGETKKGRKKKKKRVKKKSFPSDASNNIIS